MLDIFIAFDIIKEPKALVLKDKVSNLRYESKHRDYLCLIFYKNNTLFDVQYIFLINQF